MKARSSISERILFDLRSASRTLVKARVFSITAILTLALGIAPTTAVFTLINAIILQPLGYPSPDRIVLFFTKSSHGRLYGASMTKFNAWKQETQIFQNVAAYEYRPATFNLGEGASAGHVSGIRVSAGYFRLLGAPIMRGRTFTADEDRPNGEHVTVISYALWQHHFGGNGNAVGKSILLNGVSYTIVGIVGPSFNTELKSPPGLWLPFQVDPHSNDQSQFFNVIARLKPGITLAEANAGLQLVSEEFRRKYPNVMGLRDTFAVAPLAELLTGEIRPALVLLAGAVGFVLLIACANTANLLLVRATVRRREINLRMALGASRGQIIRYLLSESIVLALVGGGLALILGPFGIRVLLMFNSASLPRIGQRGAAITMDWHVPLFTLAIALGTGVLFGLAPAIGLSRSDLASTLREGGARSGTGGRQKKSQALLIISEIALAFVLLVGAGLLIRTFVALRTVDPGFNTHNVMTARTALTSSQQKTYPEALKREVRTAIPQLEAIPGVISASVSYTLPLDGMFGIPFNIVGRPASGERYDGRGWQAVSPGYFEVFGIRLIQGRTFTKRDDSAAPPVAIIDRSVASRFWPKGSPIGKLIVLGRNYGSAFDEPPRQIVGVVSDIHDSGLNQPPTPGVYVPFAQVKDAIVTRLAQVTSLAWAIRTKVPASSLLPAIKKDLMASSGGQPITKIRSMDELLSQSTAPNRFNMLVMGIFAAFALILAAIGIYGLMTYTVEQRTHEIGIMLALGAGPRRIQRMMITQGMKLAFTGIGIGVVVGLGLAHFIASFLFGVSSRNPLVFTMVALVLNAVALVAVWWPAMRASRVDAAEALRCE